VDSLVRAHRLAQDREGAHSFDLEPVPEYLGLAILYGPVRLDAHSRQQRRTGGFADGVPGEPDHGYLGFAVHMERERPPNEPVQAEEPLRRRREGSRRLDSLRPGFDESFVQPDGEYLQSRYQDLD